MKVVIYHADATLAKEFAKDTYKNLITGLKANVNQYGFPLVHLTIKGFEGLGDENYYYDGNPEEIVFNREKFFIEYLKTAEDNVYWFTEPDSRIANLFPPLTTDLSLLIRGNNKPITAAWRLARKSALPFFEEVFSYYDNTMKDWDGDTVGFIKIWQEMGSPKQEGIFKYKDISIELRNYKHYCMQKGYYTQQFKGHNKSTLLKRED